MLVGADQFHRVYTPISSQIKSLWLPKNFIFRFQISLHPTPHSALSLSINLPLPFNLTHIYLLFFQIQINSHPRHELVRYEDFWLAAINWVSKYVLQPRLFTGSWARMKEIDPIYFHKLLSSKSKGNFQIQFVLSKNTGSLNHSQISHILLRIVSILFDHLPDI